MDGSRFNFKFLAAGGNELGAWRGSRKNPANRKPGPALPVCSPGPIQIGGVRLYKFKVAIAGRHSELVVLR
jgi:hypothetical protein